jgi:hypothetical protein
MEIFSAENITPLLSAAAQADVTAWMLKASVVFFFVNRKFKTHFGGMETAMSSISSDLKAFKESISENIVDLTDSLKNLERSHSGRIDSTDERVGRLSERIKDLEGRVK